MEGGWAVYVFVPYVYQSVVSIRGWGRRCYIGRGTEVCSSSLAKQGDDVCRVSFGVKRLRKAPECDCRTHVCCHVRGGRRVESPTIAMKLTIAGILAGDRGGNGPKPKSVVSCTSPRAKMLGVKQKLRKKTVVYI